MSLDLTIATNTYAGEAAGEYIQAALLTSNSFAQNLVTVQDGVKHKFTERPLSHSNLIQDNSCSFNSQGSITIDERTVTMNEKMVNLEFCKEDFRSTWDAMQTGRGLLGTELPSNFESALLERVTGVVAENTEFNIWQGDYDPSGTSATYTDYAGLCADFEANGSLSNKIDLIDKSDGSTELTELSVAEDVAFNMQRILNAVPSRLRDRQNMAFIVSPKTADLYLQNLAELGFQDLYYSNDGTASARFQGYRVEIANGMADDTILFARSSNLKVYTDVFGDTSEVRIIDRAPIDGSNQIRVVMRWAIATMIPILDDVFMAYPDAT